MQGASLVYLANAIMAKKRNPKIIKFQNTDHFKIGFSD